ncbi:hypothetical protein AVEN_10772-1 [Araneus ventricosus]|uniref:Uncharacterized protein n=1 Tax=Araneus ventricosus TaxID=182803 RepID=A0A4Y2PWK8_ARAVE|nr:hypothetical protein AVEN_10772-1 [Araneus ventricosus]
MPRECKNHSDSFCYVCGDLTLKAQRQPLSPLLKTAHHFYFDCQVGNQDKYWALKLCCTTCYSSLTKWLKGKSIPFAMPMVCREPRCLFTDCYFCMTSTVIFSSKSKNTIHPDMPSATRRVPINESLPIHWLPKLILYSQKWIWKTLSHSMDHQRPPMMIKSIRLIYFIGNLTSLLSQN